MGEALHVLLLNTPSMESETLDLLPLQVEYDLQVHTNSDAPTIVDEGFMIDGSSCAVKSGLHGSSSGGDNLSYHLLNNSSPRRSPRRCMSFTKCSPRGRMKRSASQVVLTNEEMRWHNCSNPRTTGKNEEYVLTMDLSELNSEESAITGSIVALYARKILQQLLVVSSTVNITVNMVYCLYMIDRTIV